MQKQKRILSFQSHVVSGYVGNKAAVFPLQLNGFDVDDLNSVDLSNHTGFKNFAGSKLAADTLKQILQTLEHNSLLNYSHIILGYAGNPECLKIMFEWIRQGKFANAKITVDPVMGDNSKLYVPEEMVQIYKENLDLCECITPNQFEAELLSGRKITDQETAVNALKVLLKHVPRVVITSCDIEGKFSMFCGSKDNLARIDLIKIEGYFTGTGDLFAALLLINQETFSFVKSCHLAASTVRKVLLRTQEAKVRGLLLVQSKLDLEKQTPDEDLTIKEL